MNFLVLWQSESGMDDYIYLFPTTTKISLCVCISMSYNKPSLPLKDKNIKWKKYFYYFASLCITRIQSRKSFFFIFQKKNIWIENCSQCEIWKLTWIWRKSQSFFVFILDKFCRLQFGKREEFGVKKSLTEEGTSTLEPTNPL